MKATSRIYTEGTEFRVEKVETRDAGTSAAIFTVHWSLLLSPELCNIIIEGGFIAAEVAAWAQIWRDYEAQEAANREAADRENDRLLADWRERCDLAEERGWALPERPPTAKPAEVPKPDESKSQRDLPSLTGAEMVGAVNHVDPVTREMHQMVFIDGKFTGTPKAIVRGAEAWLVGRASIKADWSEHLRWCQMVGRKGLEFSTTQLNLPLYAPELEQASAEERKQAIDAFFDRVRERLQLELHEHSDPEIAARKFVKKLIDTGESRDRLGAMVRVLSEVANDEDAKYQVQRTAKHAADLLRARIIESPDGQRDIEQAIAEASTAEPAPEPSPSDGRAVASAIVNVMLRAHAAGELVPHDGSETWEILPKAEPTEERKQAMGLWAKDAGVTDTKAYYQTAIRLGFSPPSPAPHFRRITQAQHEQVLAELNGEQPQQACESPKSKHMHVWAFDCGCDRADYYIAARNALGYDAFIEIHEGGWMMTEEQHALVVASLKASSESSPQPAA